MSELKEALINISEEVRTKVIPENIRVGVNMFGVDGSFATLDTSDATATAKNIDEGIVAYSKDNTRIIGESPLLNALANPFVLPQDGSYAGSSEIIPCNSDTLYLVHGLSTQDMGDVITIQVSQLPIDITDKTIFIRYSPTSNNDSQMYLELFVAPKNSSFGLRKNPSKVWCYDSTGAKIPFNFYSIVTNEYTLKDVISTSWTDNGEMTEYITYITGVTWYLFTTNDMTHTGGLDAGSVYKGHGNEDFIIKTTFGSDIRPLKLQKGGVLLTRLDNSELLNKVELTPEDIRKDKKLFGITGTLDLPNLADETADATATASDIREGKTAYVNGEKITGVVDMSSVSVFESGYKRLEYIRGSGTQYINTGVIPDTTEYTALLEYYITGGWLSLGYYIYLFGQKSSAGEWTCGGTVPNAQYINISKTVGFSYTSNYNNRKVIAVSLANSVVFEHPMILFGLQNEGNIEYVKYAKFDLYNCKIYKAGVPVRDFVPCMRKSDSVVGLYDMVTNTFFENAGTGTFTAGPEV